MIFFQRHSRRGVKVVSKIFSKLTGKCFCKSLCIGVSFLIKLTKWILLWLFFDKAIPGCNFTIKVLQRGLSLWILRIFLDFFQNTLKQLCTFVCFRPLWDFTTALKTVAVFLLLPYAARAALVQPYKNNNYLTF